MYRADRRHTYCSGTDPEEFPVHPFALRRVRWAVRATLALGVAASVAANVLHARPNPISQAIAAWPPLALLLTIELISRVPMHHRTLAAARLVATAAIAGIAAWVSYWHMAAVAARYGESPSSASLLPMSVDGLIIVASVSLVELAARIRAVEEQARATGTAAPAPVAAPTAGRGTVLAPRPAGTGRPAATPVPATGTAAAARVAAPRRSTAQLSPPVAVPAPVSAAVLPPPANRRTAAVDAAAADRVGRHRRPAAETAALAAQIEAAYPEVSQTELAKRLGISPSRLRAIRREFRELEAVA